LRLELFINFTIMHPLLILTHVAASLVMLEITIILPHCEKV